MTDPAGELPEVSVIVPMERRGRDADRCLASLLAQTTSRRFEIVVVGSPAVEMPEERRLRVVTMADRNPAARRNRAAAEARGSLLAFIDDDAAAGDEWIERGAAFLQARPDALAVGGPDPAPGDSTTAELFSDTLLATPLIGSGIAAHEARSGTFRVASPHDLALVNLFVRREAFDRAGGFDESVGYIGEDTALLDALMRQGEVWYSDEIVVHHRRRRFPFAYLGQRWRYRVKTGAMLMRPRSPYRRSVKLWLFLAAGSSGLFLLFLFPAVALALLLAYAIAVGGLALRATRLPPVWWPLIPVAFALHHCVYFAGIVFGAAAEAVRRITRTGGK